MQAFPVCIYYTARDIRFVKTYFQYSSQEGRMGIYLNPRNEGFAEAVRSRIYVDKTGLIAHTSAFLNTNEKFICVCKHIINIF